MDTEEMLTHIEAHCTMLELTPLTFDERVGFITALHEPKAPPDQIGPVAIAVRRAMVERQSRQLKTLAQRQHAREERSRATAPGRPDAETPGLVRPEALRAQIEELQRKADETLARIETDPNAVENLQLLGRRISALKRKLEQFEE